ncbi:MAG: type II toxin-antitoxin system VapC family toxin [Candidatus Methanodesulfokora sp.]
MRYIFDSSAIVNLVKKGRLSAFNEGCTLDLALYESLNALWKEHLLLKKLPSDLLQEYMGLIVDLFSVIEVRSIRGLEDRVLENAVKHDITVYDSSYLTYATENDLALVTDDRKLSSRIKGIVEVRSTSEL